MDLKTDKDAFAASSDAQLVAAFLRGAEPAFEELYRRYRGALYAFLNHLVLDAAEADEIFEETWVRAIGKLPSYRDDGKFGAWLFRIGRNFYWDRCRQRKRRPTVSIDGETPLFLAGPRLEEPVEKRAEAERSGAIEAALRTLTPEQREVFLLRQQDVTFREIAEIQRTSLNTVLSRMQYALRHLRKKLADFMEKEEGVSQ